MQLKLEGREDVRLPDKRSLKGLEWSMFLRERVDVVPEKDKPIGVLSYLEEGSGDYDVSPEGCHIQAVINQEIFSALLSAIQAGRLPDGVSVTVGGLKYYGWDGYGKTWDVKALQRAPVTNLSFSILLIASKTDSSSSESIGHLPASNDDIRALEKYHRPNRLTDAHSLDSACFLGCGIVAVDISALEL